MRCASRWASDQPAGGRHVLFCLNHPKRSLCACYTCAQAACLPALQQIRPDVVKQTAMRILSAALAPNTASTAGTMASAQAVPPAQPAQPAAALRRSLLMQLSPRQVQSQCDLEPCRPPSAQQQQQLVLQQQQQQQQPMPVPWKEKSLPEYSVSAFDQEMDAYLIPVSHIGKPRLEGFGRARQS
jgi:hypothetical protein